MRKADYAALAEIIREEREHARQAHANAKTQATIGNALGRFGCARIIAERFAARANVDPAEFMKACGLGP